MIRVVVWATHLQTDILALAAHLDGCPDVALLIVAGDAAAYQREPIATALGLGAPVLGRDDPATMARVRAFAADVAVADNHVPPKGVAPRLFYMWHGLGWKARSKLDLAVFYRQVERLTGADPRRPNPNFLAQCYGPTDRAWRVRDWKLPAEACPEVGMAFASLLRAPPYDKRAAAGRYAIDVMNRKTVLLSITWHSGGVFDGDTADTDLVRRLIAATAAREANLLVCLHDRHRYSASFLAGLETAVADAPHAELRFKSDHPDNLSDLLVADVMVSNLSSFLAYHYVSGRPAIHLVRPRDGPVERVAMVLSRFRVRRKIAADSAWMIDPADTGGVQVSDIEGALQAVGAALDDSQSGGQAAVDWLARHVPRLDGNAPERIRQCLLAMSTAPVSLPPIDTTRCEQHFAGLSDCGPAKAATS
ncbi:hypothetical protein [Novosphingobium sp. Gsoil 351]|uniref:hypothetical protein n=1 Tax=Novosphingobium sp. Gsoil 351 TaxID=2675225 RepID=UPI0012B478CA|nr:hypothetical protein [Novosphingobium sp. Gsoil 351]QGN55812.1 hypothetical protein GKE62_15915 [Novosphingobium sp. Gsoil 351]